MRRPRRAHSRRARSQRRAEPSRAAALPLPRSRVGRPTSRGRAEGNSKTHTKHSKPPQLGDPDRPQGWGGWICRKCILIASPYAGTLPPPQLPTAAGTTGRPNALGNARCHFVSTSDSHDSLVKSGSFRERMVTSRDQSDRWGRYTAPECGRSSPSWPRTGCRWLVL